MISGASAQEGHLNVMRGPLDTTLHASMELYGSGSNFLLNFYQDYISPAKGGNLCPMYPSCSQYSKILFEEKPFYEAYTGTFERILRCGHELNLYSPLVVNNRTLWYDSPIYDTHRGENLSTKEELCYSQNTYPLFLSKYELKTDSTDDSFAEYLFRQQEYHRAATEYMRLSFYSKDSIKKVDYLSSMGLCYYFGRDYNGYISFINANRDLFRKSTSIANKMDLILAKIYYHLKNYQKSISTIDWSNIPKNNELFDEAQFNVGLSYARMFQWEKATKYFSQIDVLSPKGTFAKFMADTLQFASSLPSRDPWVAGTLSAVIPGSGYLYAGRTQTALTSFIVNALLIWSVRDAIRQESYGLTSVLGFFGMGWYIGNINGSVNAAREYNINVKNDYLDQLLKDIDLDKIEVEENE